MNLELWLSDQRTIEKSKKYYAHFDFRTSIDVQKEYITNPDNIAKHSFYPFIHYEKSMVKFNKNKGKKTKVRDICYASHIDTCIFQYYGFLLNELYNAKINQLGTSMVAVAYRTDLHKNNIHFAKVAVDFIREFGPCYIMIGDFTNFFDNLDHRYLKERWGELLETENLPEDHYAIFKNITRYNKWELTDLLELNNLEYTVSGRRELNSKNLVLSKDLYKKHRNHIVKNNTGYGIPQGSPISGLLANLYMLDIDKQINDYVSSLNGLYMRYNDDFIVVIPKSESAKIAFDNVKSTINIAPRLELQPEKTQYFKFENNEIANCGNEFDNSADCSNQFMNFLGFTFDGHKVRIRAKTTTKYYYRMYSKAKTIAKNGGYSYKGRRISKKNLYKGYSIRGAFCKRGNFISYVELSKGVFGNDEAIDRDTKRHMQKINKALNS